MVEPAHPNMILLEEVAERLQSVLDRLVLVGGCAVDLLITDGAAPPHCATMDVDFIVDFDHTLDYHEFSDQMATLGFHPLMAPGAPLCRFVCGGLIVDIIPVRDSVLGFGNRWYRAAYKDCSTVLLPSGRTLQSISGPAFLATKILAFQERGNDDVMCSKDLEDIIAVIDGRAELVKELTGADTDLKSFIANGLDCLIDRRDFLDALQGMMPGVDGAGRRVQIVLDRIEDLISC